MALRDWLAATPIERAATATPATPATDAPSVPRGVATVAAVAVANGSAAPAQPAAFPDDRRPCSDCRHLSRRGVCLEAGSMEVADAAPGYRPVPDLLRRCEGFRPRFPH